MGNKQTTLFLFLLASTLINCASQASPFSFYETPTGLREEYTAPYRPNKVNRLMMLLPEYYMAGPGYICEPNQPPIVPRKALQYTRHRVGYREADWVKNRVFDSWNHPVNFGGYNY